MLTGPFWLPGFASGSEDTAGNEVDRKPCPGELPLWRCGAIDGHRPSREREREGAAEFRKVASECWRKERSSHRAEGSGQKNSRCKGPGAGVLSACVWSSRKACGTGVA